MKIILLERVEKLGTIGDLVNVRPGYARNFLLPKGKALRASKTNIAYFEEKRAQFEAENLRKKGGAQEKADILKTVELVIVRHASDNGHLYGSVTARDLSDLIAEKFMEVDKTQIKIDTPIKELGIHTAKLILHPEVIVDILLSVAMTTEEGLLRLEDFKNPKKPAKAKKEEKAEEEEAVVAEDVVEIVEEVTAQADA